MFGQTVEESGKRLDAWLAAEQPEHSRARWQALIDEGRVTVGGKTVKRNTKLRADDRVEWAIPEPISTEVLPEDIPLDILYDVAYQFGVISQELAMFE